jgi:gamma-glutamyltranspeptidase/glutathione hydrolase
LAEKRGIAAAGHPESSRAAADILEAGGNAFDGALAALCAACVVEPMLASLGGGGFLMAQPAGAPSIVYDFFTHTPSAPLPADTADFYPITADFGTAVQEFHIGMGSIAVPGVVAGLFEVHRRCCRLPMAEIMAPAIRLARDGVRMNDFQKYISHILSPILEAAPEAMQLAATRERPGRIAETGERVCNTDLAATLEALVREGPELFYRGELAHQLVGDCRDRGGHLCKADLEQYRVKMREPVRFSSHGAEFSFNSPPSPSGCLIAFALGLLEDRDLEHHTWGHAHHCLSLVQAMHSAGTLRRKTRADLELDEEKVAAILDPDHLQQWRLGMKDSPMASRGTTQISVADAEGNLASLTVSNGEGCAYVLPGTGIQLNNMLGEEDLNPLGFHAWQPGRRMSSMMCPSVASLPDGGWVALGSGGSNRIRSAVLQVLLNLFEFGMPLEQAVAAPRLHLEGEHLSVEDGFDEHAQAALIAAWPDHRIWPDLNLFFGGVHAVERLPDGSFRGAGDPRRGGTVAAAR